MSEKTCIKCLISKPLSEFYPDGKRFRSDCKLCNRASRQEWRKLNPAQVLESNRKCRSKPENRAKAIQNAREYRKDPKNRTGIRKIKNKLHKKYLNKPEYRILKNLRRRMIFALHGERKEEHSLNLIGCTKEVLKAHLESKWKEGMSWENYGIHGWHIDHIKPCESFNMLDSEQQKECFHYTNLQPLWAIDNLRKSNKII